jgi:hypothetical protein
MSESLATTALYGGADALARPDCTPELEREFRLPLVQEADEA